MSTEHVMMLEKAYGVPWGVDCSCGWDGGMHRLKARAIEAWENHCAMAPSAEILAAVERPHGFPQETERSVELRPPGRRKDGTAWLPQESP